MSELSEKGLPSQREVEEALHDYLLARPSGVKTQTAYKELAQIMKIHPHQRAVTRASEGRNLWENLVRYAHRRLKDQGKVINEPRGVWSARKTK